MYRRSIYTLILLFSAALSSYAQVSLNGMVKDAETGEELIGASIFVKGTASGTISDFDGTFQIEVPSLPVTLIISYTGYKKWKNLSPMLQKRLK